ncbi:halovibrin HvnA [Pseudomonas beijingensis]|uniref:Halovibrin HvnA n=1 Tax=Pseudomonas beijingensis TaxID=2954101 RepID=A0ABY9F4V0_9PSED|nr:MULTISPECIES: halovibrin HvnA [unclassified Pseudomonas]WLG98663.1 halovibrin HvnA [Pseudomonas sp. FP2034]WLH43713.1 halovibrin HvnA [Pseudomonas sp. FP2262]WLI43799.1 halovibrin HvnA [Pseudomonas sp. FP830]
MKTLILWVMLVLAGATVSQQALSLERLRSGVQIAAELTQRYNDIRDDCGSPSMPSFLCTGVMLRSTIPGDGYFTWNPSPYSRTSGGVAFSFLRKDAKFSGLVYGQNSGFIFYPVLTRPADTFQVEVLCAYPSDGATNNRDQAGCGAHPYALDRSRRCQTIGVTTAEQWIANRQEYAWNLCGFDVSDDMNEMATSGFKETIRAHNLGNFFAGTFDYIELVVATWPQHDNPTPVPLEAFFYTNDGLARAQRDQMDYFNQSGRGVPIIKLELPQNPSADAVFSYLMEDQRVLLGL